MKDLNELALEMVNLAKSNGVENLVIVLDNDDETAVMLHGDSDTMENAMECMQKTHEKLTKLEKTKEEPKEIFFLMLIKTNYPNLYESMPEEIRQDFIKRFQNVSEEKQEALFHRTKHVLNFMQEMHK